MARSGRHSLGLSLALTAGFLVATGGAARGDDIAVQGEVIVPERTTRTETVVEETEVSPPVASAYGKAIDMSDVDAARDAFAAERPPNKAVGVAESFGALIFNSFFFPIKLALGTGGAFVGGVTGAMTGGDERAAAQVWNVTTDGSYFVTPARMEGRSRLRFTGDHP